MSSRRSSKPLLWLPNDEEECCEDEDFKDEHEPAEIDEYEKGEYDED